MSDIKFILDGKSVSAKPGQTIWQVAKQHNIDIPHLCYADKPGYRGDGNCRACMVEIDGERVLAPSCIRYPSEGMTVTTASERATKARKMVFELLTSDMIDRQQQPDPNADFWQWSDAVLDKQPRYGRIDAHDNIDMSNPAIAVNLDACIACGLCVRACREVQHNDVIGMALRGAETRPVFDIDDPMGDSTCVTCGECVQICPTGALLEKSLLTQQSGTAVKTSDPAIEKIETVCPYCGVGCRTEVSVKDDKIIRVDGANGPANENRLCVKGRFGYDYINSSQRLTEPLIRLPDAAKGEAVSFADRYKFYRKASWNEAISIASAGFKQILKTNSGSALAGFGSAKCSNEEAYLFQKLIRQGFGTNNVDHCTRLCHASSVAALIEGIGSGAVTAPFTAVMDAECVIVIGARPAQNHPVAATYIKDAANKGAKLYVMDPRYQELSRHGEMIQFKPGSDVALLNAIINVIINENLTNNEYIKNHTTGFNDLVEANKDFTPENMAVITGIDAQTIRKIAREYATSKSIILWGMGISQHTHGTDNARCLIALALITGNVGRPGTGLHPLRGQNNVQGASDAGLIPMVYPDYKAVDDPQNRTWFEEFWQKPLDPEKGLTAVEILNAAHDGSIKGMYIMGENPAMSDPDTTHCREALAKLEHLVVQDIFMTETAWYADVILPATAHAEKQGTYTNSNRQVQIGRPVVKQPGNARQDWQIIVDVANGIDLNWHYDDVSAVYAEMAQTMPSLNNITWQRLEREGYVTYPAPEPGKPGQDVLFGDSFPTSDGRGHIVATKLLPPAELPDDKFPFVLTTGRLLEHWHTGAMTRKAGVLNDIEPEATAAMNPLDINKLQLAAGNRIAVTTRRGKIELYLRADASLPQGMVFVPFCYGEAAANVLTNPALDPFGKIPEFKYCAAAVAAS